MMRHRRPDAASLDQVRESLKSLHVAMGHARLYGAQHKETWRAMEGSLQALEPILETWGAVELEAAPNGLLWGGELVHAETEELIGLGRLLHREGIASLSLATGIELDELGRLLDVLRINFELPEYEEETLESLLWQAGFERVGFQAVSTLMEAEALSGRISQPQPELDIGGEIKRVVELAVQDAGRGDGRRNFGQVSEDVVQRAVARSDLAGLGPTQDGHRFAEEEQTWRTQFAAEGTEDADVIRQSREDVERESPADLLARLISVLMRAVVADRRELPASDAIGLARQAVEEVYRRGDAVGLVRILDEGTTLLEEPEVRNAATAGQVREFFANAISSRRIARVLLSLDLAKAGDEDELRRLVERLPDAVLQSVLENASRDPDQARGKRLRETLGQVVGDRIDAWLTNAIGQPPERVVPTIALARSLGRDRAASSRYKLLAHPSRLVREEVLRWYAEFLPPDELQHVLKLVLDPHPDVRRATADALAANRPYDAVKWLRRVIETEGFSRREPRLKRDICITFGLVAQEGAVDVLDKLLNHKTKTFGTDPEVMTDIEAAARGLAAVGTVAAKLALKRGTSGLFGARKKACADGLRRLEEGKPW